MPLFSQSGYGSGKYGVADTGPLYSMSLYYYLGLLTSEYRLAPNLNFWLNDLLSPLNDTTNMRSEERRVGKEGRYWRDWSSDVCSSDLPLLLSRAAHVGIPACPKPEFLA